MSPAQLGSWAEAAVADYLFAQGFSLLWRNVRLGRLELDIVARKQDLVAVVEVRARRPGALVPPFASVTAQKLARVTAATRRLWRDKLRAHRDIHRLRIDVAAVTLADGVTRLEYAMGVGPASRRAIASWRRELA